MCPSTDAPFKEIREQTEGDAKVARSKIQAQRPTSANQAPSPKMPTISQSITSSWDPSLQHTSLWGAIYIQIKTPIPVYILKGIAAFMRGRDEV